MEPQVSLNVTQAAVHKERWREETTTKKIFPRKIMFCSIIFECIIVNRFIGDNIVHLIELLEGFNTNLVGYPFIFNDFQISVYLIWAFSWFTVSMFMLE